MKLEHPDVPFSIESDPVTYQFVKRYSNGALEAATPAEYLLMLLLCKFGEMAATATTGKKTTKPKATSRGAGDDDTEEDTEEEEDDGEEAPAPPPPTIPETVKPVEPKARASRKDGKN